MSDNLPKCDIIDTTPIPHGVSNGVSDLNRLVDDNFLTVLNIPDCLGGYVSEVCGRVSDISLKHLQLSVMNFEIPPITVPTQEKKYLSATRRESSKSLEPFSDVTVSFKLDDQLLNYNTLYKWVNMLVDTSKGAMSNKEKSSYETTYDVILLDEYRKPAGMYSFQGVIPVSIGSIPLDYRSSGESIFIDFTFSFDFLSFELAPK